MRIGGEEASVGAEGGRGDPDVVRRNGTTALAEGLHEGAVALGFSATDSQDFHAGLGDEGVEFAQVALGPIADREARGKLARDYRRNAEIVGGLEEGENAPVAAQKGRIGVRIERKPQSQSSSSTAPKGFCVASNAAASSALQAPEKRERSRRFPPSPKPAASANSSEATLLRDLPSIRVKYLNSFAYCFPVSIDSSSISKTRTEFGPMALPAPFSP